MALTCVSLTTAFCRQPGPSRHRTGVTRLAVAFALLNRSKWPFGVVTISSPFLSRSTRKGLFTAQKRGNSSSVSGCSKRMRTG